MSLNRTFFFISQADKISPFPPHLEMHQLAAYIHTTEPDKLRNYLHLFLPVKGRLWLLKFRVRSCIAPPLPLFMSLHGFGE